MRYAHAVLALMLTTGLHATKPAPVTVPPKIVKRVAPEYTEAVRQAGFRGSVLLKATVDETGRLIHISVLPGLPPAVVEQAIKTVRQWEFEPATRRGNPVKCTVHLEVNFRFAEPVRR